MKHSGKLRAYGALFAFWLLLTGYRGSAAVSQPSDLCALSAASSAIVQGRVEDIVSGWVDPVVKLIESEVVVRVSDDVQGGITPGSQLTLRVRGGQMGDLAMVTSEEASFTEGEDVLLFVTATEHGRVVTAGSQGKFQLVDGVAVQQSSQRAYRTVELRAALAARSTDAERGACAIALAAVPAPLASRAAGESAAGAPSVNVSPDAYVYNGYKWSGPNPMEEQYFVNINTGHAGSGNGTVDQFRDAIIAAGKTWNAVPSADFLFRYGGTSTATTTGYDGVNLIHWEDLGDGPTLAQATTWYSGGRIMESDIRINEAQPWDATGAPASSEADLQSVVLHEMGHWLSLGHDNDPVCSNCPAAGPSMCSCYRMGSLKRTLAANDVTGISALYPQAAITATPTAPVPPTAVPAWWRETFLPMLLRR